MSELNRRQALKTLAAAPLVGLGLAASKPELATGFLPDGRRLYQLNRVGADGVIHWVSGTVSTSPAHRFRLRLARCVDEVSGEAVPEHPATQSVFGENMGWEEALTHLKCCHAAGIGPDPKNPPVAPDQVLVQPEAKVPVYYSDLNAFARYLACPRCAARTTLAEVRDRYAHQFRYVDFEAYMLCPACDYAGNFGPPSYEFAGEGPTAGLTAQRIVLRWNPAELEPIEDTFNGRVHYLWRIPEDYRQRVRAGDLRVLPRVLPGVTAAIRRGQDFLLRGDMITHVA